jgi:hypothetical protein
MPKQPKQPTLNLPEIPPVEMWEYPHEVDAIIWYVRGQYMAGQQLEGHFILNRDLERLEEYGYPSEKIQQIKDEFETPVGEREFDFEMYASAELAGWLNSVRDMLHREFTEEGIPKVTRDKLIEESIIGETLNKIPLSKADKIKNSMQARARNFLIAIRKAGADTFKARTPTTREPEPEAIPTPQLPPLSSKLDVVNLFDILGPGGSVKDLKKRCAAELKYEGEPLLACTMYARLILHFTRTYLLTPDEKARAAIEPFLTSEPGLTDKLDEIWTMFQPDGEVPAKIRETALHATRDILHAQYGRIVHDEGQLTKAQLEKSREIAEAVRAKTARPRKKKAKPKEEYPLEVKVPTADDIKAEIDAKIEILKK